MPTLEEIQKFKNQLLEDEKRLETEVGELETPTDFGSAPDGGDEENDEDEEFENRTGAASDLKTRLSQVQLALAKIEEGVYGTCTNCNEEISNEVLSAAPESSLCESCKSVS